MQHGGVLGDLQVCRKTPPESLDHGKFPRDSPFFEEATGSPQSVVRLHKTPLSMVSPQMTLSSVARLQKTLHH